jgi:hypothetical protein
VHVHRAGDCGFDLGALVEEVGVERVQSSGFRVQRGRFGDVIVVLSFPS